jgi:hypothetical protein
MILEEEKREIQSNFTGMVAGYQIDTNSSLAFELLRTKLYSSPTYSVVREILSNGRDAHREKGNVDIPLKVYLPTQDNPHLTIEDSGIGMSPERIDTVYRWFLRSTKRDTNDQTGSFGLGAKSVFAIADQFSVTTTFDGVTYEYLNYLGENNRGDILLVSEEYTGKESGTIVKIPIDRKDFGAISDACYYYTYFWDVPAVIYGGNYQPKKPKVAISGTNWILLEEDVKFRFLVDGIPYEGEYEFNAKCESNNLVFLINTGEVSLSMSREALYYNDPTQAKVESLYNTYKDEILAKIQEIIDSKNNLLEVLKFVQQVHDGKLGEARCAIPGIDGTEWTWQGQKFKYPGDWNEFYFQSVDKEPYSRRNSLRYIDTTHVGFEENAKYIIHDHPLIKETSKAYDYSIGDYVETVSESYKLPPQTKRKFRAWLYGDDPKRNVKAYIVRPISGELYDLFRAAADNEKIFLLSKTVEYKSPKPLKRPSVIYGYSPLNHGSTRIDLNTNKNKYVYVVTINPKNCRHHNRKLKDCAAIHKYSLLFIDAKYEAKALKDPNFMSVEEFFKKHLFKKVAKKECQKTLNAHHLTESFNDFKWLVEKIDPDAIRQTKIKASHDKYLPLILAAKETNQLNCPKGYQLNLDEYPILKLVGESRLKHMDYLNKKIVIDYIKEKQNAKS